MDIWEKKYQDQGFSSQRRYPNEALISFLASHYFSLPFEQRAKLKILDLGCGSGANLWMVAKQGFDVYGIDTAPTGIELCRKMLDYWQVRANIKLGDMRQLDFEDEFFDAVFDIVSMQHLDLRGHLASYKEIFRSLKPSCRFFQWHLGARSASFLQSNGKLIDKLTLDNISDPTKPLLDIPFNKAGLTCFLTPTDAKEMLRSAGFQNISVEVFTKTCKAMTQSTEFLAITAQKQ